MLLRSPWLFALVVAVAVVVFAVTVWLTGRLQRGFWHGLARAGLILVTCLCLLVSVGVKLNNDNGWYTSWSDLLGAQSATSTQVSGATNARTQATTPRQSRPVTLPALPRPGVRLQHYTWRGPKSGVSTGIDVILPPSYFTPQARNRRYPVVEAFHGFPGSPGGWTAKMNVQRVVDDVVSQRQIGESIIVVPQISANLGLDTECVNGPAGSVQSETWLTSDVPSFIRTHFRASSGPDSWAAMGYSAGGWCASMAAVLHPDVFGAAISLSGYFVPEFSGTSPWPADSAAAKRYDLTAVVRRSPPNVALWVQFGKLSGHRPQAEQFLKVVRPPMSVTSVVLASSGHRWDVWQAQFPSSLKWLGTTLPGFRP